MRSRLAAFLTTRKFTTIDLRKNKHYNEENAFIFYKINQTRICYRNIEYVAKF